MAGVNGVGGPIHYDPDDGADMIRDMVAKGEKVNARRARGESVSDACLNVCSENWYATRIKYVERAYRLGREDAAGDSRETIADRDATIQNLRSEINRITREAAETIDRPEKGLEAECSISREKELMDESVHLIARIRDLERELSRSAKVIGVITARIVVGDFDGDPEEIRVAF